MTANDADHSTPAATRVPPVLEYGAETVSSRLNRPIGPTGPTALAAVLTVVAAGLASAGSVPFPVVAGFAAAVAFMTYVTFRGRAEWDVPSVAAAQLALAATLFAVGGLIICARAGESNGTWGDPAYWWTQNQGYRYGRRYALQPWPAVALGLAWFVATAAVSVWPRWRARSRRPLAE